jgi:replicative DNA helicase
MHRAVIKEGVKFVIIDYMGFLSGDDQRSRVAEIGQISRAIKAAAKELKVPIMVLNQLNRKCEERPDKRPRLSDLRDSGDLEQDADNVLLLFRSAAYNRDPNDPKRHTAEIILAKQRNGPVGTVSLLFIENQMEFASMAKHQQCDY